MTTGLNLDYTLFIPEYMLVGLVLIVMGLDLYVPQMKKTWLAYIAATGLFAAAGVSLAWTNKETNFASIIAIDNYTTYFRVFFMSMGAVVCLSSGEFVQDKFRHPGEYYASDHPLDDRRGGHGGVARADDGVSIARVAELQPLCTCLVREVRPALKRGWTEVPAAGRVLISDAAIWHQPDLRAHGQHLLRRDCRQPLERDERVLVRAAHGAGADHRRAGVQGCRGAVPHVDAGRLRRRACCDHGVPVHDIESGGLRDAAAALWRGVPGRPR